MERQLAVLEQACQQEHMVKQLKWLEWPRRASARIGTKGQHVVRVEQPNQRQQPVSELLAGLLSALLA